MGIFKKRFKATQLKSADEFEQLLGDGRPLLIDFYKFNCQPCQIMDGIVDEVADEFQEEALLDEASGGLLDEDRLVRQDAQVDPLGERVGEVLGDRDPSVAATMASPAHRAPRLGVTSKSSGAGITLNVTSVIAARVP